MLVGLSGKKQPKHKTFHNPAWMKPQIQSDPCGCTHTHPSASPPLILCFLSQQGEMGERGEKVKSDFRSLNILDNPAKCDSPLGFHLWWWTISWSVLFPFVNMMDWVVFRSQCCLVHKYSDISLFIDPEDPDCFSLLQLGSGYRMRDHTSGLGQHWCLNQIIGLSPPEPTADSSEVAPEKLCHLCLSWAQLDIAWKRLPWLYALKHLLLLSMVLIPSKASELFWRLTKSETRSSNMSPWRWIKLKGDASEREAH